VGLGLPKDRAAAAYAMLTSDAERLGVIQTIKGERYVNLGAKKAGPSHPAPSNDTGLDNDEIDAGFQDVLPVTLLKPSTATENRVGARRVFITHGKDKGIRDQIEEIVKYGGFKQSSL
jgi:hypothetical protein